jgi:hypothetical protein
VDRDLAVLSWNHHDNLEQIASRIGTDAEPAVWFSGVFDCQRMVDRVEDVLVGAAVFARRVVNLHALIVIRKKLLECFFDARADVDGADDLGVIDPAQIGRGLRARAGLV